MNVFNPKILDASIRDITSNLKDEQKADVLLYAMQHLQLERSRTLIENAVQSCLLVSKLSPENTAKALLTRAKTRLANGCRVSAHQDIDAALVFEPNNAEAKSLMMHLASTFVVAHSMQTLRESKTTLGFSTEIWREIATWLPRRDLKTLLLVAHVLSRIASQMIFRKLDLHFASDKWDSQRSADILTRIITDTEFANNVRTLRVFVPGRDIFPMTFQTGMLANALPKLTNLRHVHISMRWRDSSAFLKILENTSSRIRGLSLMPFEGPGEGEVRFPKFKHITQFSYAANGGSPKQLYDFLAQNQGSIRSISLQNLNWDFPSDVLSIRNLTHLDFLGTLSPDSHAFADIMNNGHQLEYLRVQCVLECNASVQFRDCVGTLPFLRHFAFSLIGYRVNDYDLFPAISDFLRDRKKLHTLHLKVPSADWAQRRLGYDANVWGVLPSLTSLRSLSATLPKDVAAAVAMWLVPRSVQALSFHALPEGDPLTFVSQLRPGVPPSLKFVGFSNTNIDDLTAVLESGFPMVRLARVDEEYFTVKHTVTGQIQLEEWSKGRTQYNASEWLESLGCQDAEWRDPREFM